MLTDLEFRRALLSFTLSQDYPGESQIREDAAHHSWQERDSSSCRPSTSATPVASTGHTYTEEMRDFYLSLLDKAEDPSSEWRNMAHWRAFWALDRRCGSLLSTGGRLDDHLGMRRWRAGSFFGEITRELEARRNISVRDQLMWLEFELNKNALLSTMPIGCWDNARRRLKLRFEARCFFLSVGCMGGGQVSRLAVTCRT
jgi:hypothetical protein